MSGLRASLVPVPITPPTPPRPRPNWGLGYLTRQAVSTCMRVYVYLYVCRCIQVEWEAPSIPLWQEALVKVVKVRAILGPDLGSVSPTPSPGR